MNSPRRIRLLLLLVLGASFISTKAQTVTESITLLADKDAFSVTVPREFISHKEATWVSVYYRGDGVSGSVKRDKANGLERLMWIRPQRDDKTAYQSVKFEGFTIIRAVSKNETGAYWDTLHIGTEDRYYIVSAHGKDKDDQGVRAVLDSIRLNGRPLFKNGKATDPRQTQAMDIAVLDSSPEVKEALKRPDASSKVARYEKLGNEDIDDGSSTVFTRPLTIIRKEKASYTDDARTKGVKGSVHGRVLFKADGTIGEIIMDPTLDRGLARRSADAARRIKFLPAEIDGKPVDQWRPITYTFDIY